MVKYSATIADFYNQVSVPGQWEYPFELELPEWLPSAFILQSDLTRNGRRCARIAYRLRAQLTPFGGKSMQEGRKEPERGIGIPRFFTKRHIFIYRKSGVTDKHFSEETMPDLENVGYNNPRCNPSFSLRHSSTQVRVSIERIFYYVGDTITVQVQVDNAEGKLHVSGIELALTRSIEAEGPSEYHDKKVCTIREQVTLKTHKFDVKCKKADQNIFKLDFELPAIDDVSWMPSNLTDDEEATLSYFTPTTLGQAVKIRYFILTRLLYKKLPYE